MALYLLLLILGLSPCLSIRAPELLYADTQPTPCSAAACPHGRCGFTSCAAPVACRGGGCMFINCTSPTCDGGACKFVDCAHPECRGGACDFVRTQTMLLDNFCAGGGCTNEGFAAKHKASGGSSF